jgi:hypothetical protein
MNTRTKGALTVGGIVLGGGLLIWLATRKAGAAPPPPPPPEGSISFGTLTRSGAYPFPDATYWGTVDFACPITNHEQGGTFNVQLWMRTNVMDQGWSEPVRFWSVALDFQTGATIAWSQPGPGIGLMLQSRTVYEFWLVAPDGTESNRVTASW